MYLSLAIVIAFILIFLVIYMPEEFIFGMYGRLILGFATFLWIYNFILLPILFNQVLNSNIPLIFKFIFWNLSWLVLIQIVLLYALYDEFGLSIFIKGIGVLGIGLLWDWMMPPWILTLSGTLDTSMLGAGIKPDAVAFFYTQNIPLIWGKTFLGISSDFLLMYFIFPLILLTISIFLIAPNKVRETLLS